MRNILVLILATLLVQPSWALGYAEHIDYLSKLVPTVTVQSQSFSDLDLINHPAVLSWLKDLDAKLNPVYLGTYDADLLLNFSADGHVTAISVSDLREQNLDKFKSFIAKIQTLQACPLPNEISSETVFKLDAAMLYIERSESYLTKLNAGCSKLKAEGSMLNFSELLNHLQIASTVALELIEPRYIDYPYIGEKLQLKLIDPKYAASQIYAHVLDLDTKAMMVKVYRVDDKLINLVFSIARPSKDSCSTLATVISSGLSSAAGAGIMASVASNGIIPGALALTTMAVTTMKERDELLSFNLVKGDKLILVNKGETKGERK